MLAFVSLSNVEAEYRFVVLILVKETGLAEPAFTNGLEHPAWAF